LDTTWNVEEIRRNDAHHEAAHAVAHAVYGRTVRYLSIETEGTEYRNICVTAVNHMKSEGGDLVPVPWEASGNATSILAGEVAAWREAGKPHPYDSWQQILSECEGIEELEDAPGDLDEPEPNAVKIRTYCELAASFLRGPMMPGADEVSEGTPSTGEQAFKAALREAERLVDQYWWAITAVAERLIEKGYLTGEEAEDIVFGFDPSEERT
jgi:hypothetical protein